MNHLLPLAALAFLCCNQSKPHYRNDETPTMPITFSVLGTGQNPVILPPTAVNVTKGNSVIQASIEVFTMQNIPYTLGGEGNESYITSINGLSQASYGPLSGWLYKVNGTFPDLYPNEYTLKSGDIVEWVYSINGKDVGYPMHNGMRKNNCIFPSSHTSSKK